MFENLTYAVFFKKGKIHPMKDNRGSGGISCTLSLTSVLDGVDGQCQTPATLLLGKIAGTHCVGG